MRRLVKPGRRNEYWENIDPQRLAEHIDALPAKHELFYFAKLVSEGLMRDMDSVSQFRYARVREGTMRYLVESQDEDDIISMELLYDPFFFIVCKLFPTMKTGTFSHIFQQFLRFVSKQVPACDEDEVCALIKRFVDRIKKG
jgi:hypothetical protein